MYNFLAALALLLAQNVYVLDPGDQPAPRGGSGALQISCPAVDFSVFVRAFLEDVNIQKAFTKYPLKKQWLDPDAELEPKEFIQEIGLNKLQFPIIPLHEERVKRSLDIRIDSVTANNAKITLVKPDADYEVSYFFKKNGCWRLIRIEDWSL